MILHLVARSEWEAAPADQAYTPASFAKDGFIHCTAGDDLLLQVANQHYKSAPGEFLVLSIDESKVTGPMKWETPDGEPRASAIPAPEQASAGAPAMLPEAEAELGAGTKAGLIAQPAVAPPAPTGPAFPHVYGALNRDAIVAIRCAVRSGDGAFTGFAPYAGLPPRIDDRLPYKKAADELLEATDAFSESLARYKDRIEARMDEIDKNIKDKLAP